MVSCVALHANQDVFCRPRSTRPASPNASTCCQTESVMPIETASMITRLQQPVLTLLSIKKGGAARHRYERDGCSSRGGGDKLNAAGSATGATRYTNGVLKCIAGDPDLPGGVWSAKPQQPRSVPPERLKAAARYFELTAGVRTRMSLSGLVSSPESPSGTRGASSDIVRVTTVPSEQKVVRLQQCVEQPTIRLHTSTTVAKVTKIKPHGSAQH